QVHDKLFHLVTKAFATWSDPRTELSALLHLLELAGDQLLRHRPRTSSPMMTVSALLPELSLTNIRRVMAALEANTGNGFHNVALSLTWPMIEEMHRAGNT